MITFLNLFLMFAIFVMVFCFFMIIRNERVARERKRLLDIVALKAKKLIKEGKDWEEPYNYFRSISYDEMVYKFWKPVKSFYDYSKFE